MAIALVGSSALANQNAVNTNAVSVTRTFTAGNCAVAVVSIFRQTTFSISSVTDTAGNTWNLLTGGTADTTGQFQRVALAYAMNVASGSTTITFNLSSTAVTYSNCGVSEFSGVATANAQDATSTRSEVSTAVTDISATAISTTRAGDLIYGVAMVRSFTDTNINFGSPTSWTNTFRQNDNVTAGSAPCLDAGYWLPGSVQTNYAPAWTHDNDAGSEGAAVVLALQQPAYALTAAQGSFTLGGQAASLEFGRKLASASGTFTLTGQAAALSKGRTLAVDSGTFALTGKDAAFLRGYVVNPETGAFVLTGQDATLTPSTAPAAETSRPTGGWFFLRRREDERLEPEEALQLIVREGTNEQQERAAAIQAEALLARYAHEKRSLEDAQKARAQAQLRWAMATAKRIQQQRDDEDIALSLLLID